MSFWTGDCPASCRRRENNKLVPSLRLKKQATFIHEYLSKDVYQRTTKNFKLVP